MTPFQQQHYLQEWNWRKERRPEGMNHFCRGHSGSGEWSHKSTEVPCVCGYCGEPNMALILERVVNFHQIKVADLTEVQLVMCLGQAISSGDFIRCVSKEGQSVVYEPYAKANKARQALQALKDNYVLEYGPGGGSSVTDNRRDAIKQALKVLEQL